MSRASSRSSSRPTTRRAVASSSSTVDNGGDLQIDEPSAADAEARIRDSQERAHHRARPGRQPQRWPDAFGSDGALYLSRPATAVPGRSREQCPEPGARAREDPADRPEPGGRGRPRLSSHRGSSPSGDTTAPKLHARAPRRQRVLRHRGTIVYVRCNENCSVERGRHALDRPPQAAFAAREGGARRGPACAAPSCGCGRARSDCCGGRCDTARTRGCGCACARPTRRATAQRWSGAACASGASRRSRKRRSTGFVASSSARA